MYYKFAQCITEMSDTNFYQSSFPKIALIYVGLDFLI